MKIEIRNHCTDFNSYRSARVKSLFNVETGADFSRDVDLPIEGTEWKVGLVVGPSGSGKTSIGRRVFADLGDAAIYQPAWAADKPIVDTIGGEDFDAVTGALTRVGLAGAGGQKLDQLWANGPRTYLGVSIPRFPNLLFVGGPHFPFANVPRGADVQIDFVADLVKYLFDHGITRVEPDEAAEQAWTDHVIESSAPFLVADSSWFRGANIPGKADVFMLYTGGLVTYGNRLDDVAAKGYEGFRLSGAPAPVGSAAG